MRSLLDLLLRYYFVILFFVLLGFSFFLLVEHNKYHNAVLNSKAHSITGKINKHLATIREYLLLKEANQQLIDENIALRNQMAKYHKVFTSDQFNPYDTLYKPSYQYEPAQVLSNSVNKQYNQIIINKGSLDGIEEDMAVIASDGIVGLVSDVSRNFSLVLPLINRKVAVSVKIKKNDYFGSLSWDGVDYRQLHLKEIPKHVDVSSGDEVVTSGFSLSFPEGIPVGEIVEVEAAEGNFLQIIVAPYVEFKNLTYVYVVKSKISEEIQNLQNDMKND